MNVSQEKVENTIGKLALQVLSLETQLEQALVKIAELTSEAKGNEADKEEG